MKKTKKGQWKLKLLDNKTCLLLAKKLANKFKGYADKYLRTYAEDYTG